MKKVDRGTSPPPKVAGSPRRSRTHANSTSNNGSSNKNNNRGDGVGGKSNKRSSAEGAVVWNNTRPQHQQYHHSDPTTVTGPGPQGGFHLYQTYSYHNPAAVPSYNNNNAQAMAWPSLHQVAPYPSPPNPSQYAMNQSAPSYNYVAHNHGGQQRSSTTRSPWNTNAQQYVPPMNVVTANAPPSFQMSYTNSSGSQKLDPNSKPFDADLCVNSKSNDIKPATSLPLPSSNNRNQKPIADGLQVQSNSQNAEDANSKKDTHDTQQNANPSNKDINGDGERDDDGDGDGFTTVVRKKNEGKASKAKGANNHLMKSTKNGTPFSTKQGKVGSGVNAAKAPTQGAAVILRRPGGATSSSPLHSTSSSMKEQAQGQHQTGKNRKKKELQNPNCINNAGGQKTIQHPNTSGTHEASAPQTANSKAHSTAGIPPRESSNEKKASKTQVQPNANKAKKKGENGQKNTKSKQKYHDLNLSDLIVLPGEEAQSKKSRKKKLQKQQQQQQSSENDTSTPNPKAMSSTPMIASPPPLLSDSFPSLSSAFPPLSEAKPAQTPLGNRSQTAASGAGQYFGVGIKLEPRQAAEASPTLQAPTTGLGQASWATKQPAAAAAARLPTQETDRSESTNQITDSKGQGQTTATTTTQMNNKNGSAKIDNKKSSIPSKKPKQQEKTSKTLPAVPTNQGKKANGKTAPRGTNTGVFDPRVMQSFGDSFTAFAMKGKGAKSLASTANGMVQPIMSIKKGKQRIGPRTKRLTTLKKRVLQERLQKYKVAEALKKETESNSSSQSLDDDDTTGQRVTDQKEQDMPKSSVSPLASKTVCLLNFLDQDDDLEDDDEFEEISNEICGLTRGVGPIEGIYLPRSISDEETSLERLSFVKFQNASDAARANHCWNGMVLGGTPLETCLVVNISTTTRSVKETTESDRKGIAIAIYNALSDEDREDEECQEETLSDIKLKLQEHARVGEIYVAKINPTHEELVIDIIIACFDEDSLEAPMRAIRAFNGMQLGGETLYAELALEEKRSNIDFPADVGDDGDSNDAAQTLQPMSTPSKSGHIVVMKGVLSNDDLDDEECLEETKEDITSIVEKYGDVKDIVLCTSGRHRGNVFVTYENYEIASKALDGLSSTVLGGIAFDAYLCSDISQEEEEETTNDTTCEATGVIDKEDGILYLSNVLNEEDLEDEDCIEECLDDLKEIVSKFGIVESISLCKDEPQSGHGQVQVTFEGGIDVARAAKPKLNDVVIGGQKLVARFASDDIKFDNDNKITNQPAADPTNESKDITIATKKQNDTTVDAPKEPVVTASGKVLSERWAECKRAPKIPNAQPSRSYAYKLQNPETIPLLQQMLGKLMAFQIKSKDDSNARARRRMVMGFREAARGLRANKVKMVVLANNLDEYGAIEGKTEEILNMCRDKEIPLFFEFNKRKLGKAIGKSIKIGIVAIQNADGAHDEFKKLKKILAKEAPVF